ncbi:fimbrial biogenesis outer membrane usher protein [Burkholderia multivorans]|nr:fimbrial biogenesis outer membrane usher protein [Burkholderia multivorans]VWB45554.1 fimbrial protein [Burkholderia ubonensis]
MECADRAERRCACPQMPVPCWSCAMVLFACSAMALDAAGSEHVSAAGDNAGAGSVRFNPDLVAMPPGSDIDLSGFERGNPVWPGQYRADVYLNGMPIGRDDVTVRAARRDLPQICLGRTLFGKLNADPDRVSPDALAMLDEPAACVPLDALLPGASASFDAGAARLDVQIPQALLRRATRGYVDPSKWDDGVTAGWVGYNANVYRNVARGQGTSAAYVGLNAGVNVGSWYFRHDGALNWQQRGDRRYDVANTYVQHDLTALEARIRIGDANTSGELFDTFAFRGVQVATDDRMWPDSQRGYAPVVRGIANTNARVTIRQSGALIYETAVPPGPFVIDDLFPTGYGGDLDVTVIEADGGERAFRVPNASVAQSLRPGRSRFSVVAGIVRNVDLSYTPRVMQATYSRGVTNLLTLYGGVLANEHYQSLLAGSALNTPLGAIALDVSGASTSAHGQRLRGTSMRVTYSKTIASTNSNLSVAAYRFSSSGYVDFGNALVFVDNAKRGLTGAAARPAWRTRSRVSITAAQPLGGRWGQLYASGFTQNYWARSGTDTQFHVGYSNFYRRFDYSVSVDRTRTFAGDADTQVMLTVSMPLGSTPRAPRLSVNVVRDSLNGVTSMASATGFIGAANEGSYSVSGSRDAGATYSGTVSGQYRTPVVAVQGALGKGSGYGSGSFGVGGGVVVHPGGVTATPYAADTMAVVAAPAAGGAAVAGYGGIRLDRRGYAVVPHLNPYRLNQIEINPRGLPADVELRTTSQQVAPRQGAVVMLRYPTVKGRPLLIRTTTPDGVELPFGAPVFDGNGDNVGIVSQGGQIYVRITAPNDTLTVKWGRADAWRCSIKVALPPPDRQAAGIGIERIDAPCELEAEPADAFGGSPRGAPAARRSPAGASR